MSEIRACYPTKQYLKGVEEKEEANEDLLLGVEPGVNNLETALETKMLPDLSLELNDRPVTLVVMSVYSMYV